MDIAQFASLRLEFEQGAVLASVLEREGLTHLQWLAHERRSLCALVDSMRRGDRSLADRYAAAFDPPAAETSAGEAEQCAPLPARSPASPTYAVAAISPAAAPAPPAPIAAAPAPVPIHAVDETSLVGTISPSEALPFRADAEAASPPSISSEMMAEAHSMVGETAEVGVLTAADLAAWLPFAKEQAAAEVDATAEVSVLTAADLASVLPFDSGKDGRAPPPIESAAVEDQLSTSVGETSFVGVIDADAMVLPFAAATANEANAPVAPDGELTLEQYASLRCELDHGRRQRSEVLASYGIGTEDALSRVKKALGDRPRPPGVRVRAMEYRVHSLFGDLVRHVTMRPDRTIEPESALDGVMLRYSPAGQLTLVKYYPVGAIGWLGHLIPEDGGMTLVAFIEGRVPDELRLDPALPDGFTGATLLAHFDARGKVTWAQPLGRGERIVVRIVRVRDGYVVLSINEQRRCELAKWEIADP